jgi:hypothetical protein
MYVCRFGKGLRSRREGPEGDPRLAPPETAVARGTSRREATSRSQERVWACQSLR